jgi:hypothetical protein
MFADVNTALCFPMALVMGAGVQSFPPNPRNLGHDSLNFEERICAFHMPSKDTLLCLTYRDNVHEFAKMCRRRISPQPTPQRIQQ